MSIWDGLVMLVGACALGMLLVGFIRLIIRVKREEKPFEDTDLP